MFKFSWCSTASLQGVGKRFRETRVNCADCPETGVGGDESSGEDGCKFVLAKSLGRSGCGDSSFSFLMRMRHNVFYQYVVVIVVL